MTTNDQKQPRPQSRPDTRKPAAGGEVGKKSREHQNPRTDQNSEAKGGATGTGGPGGTGGSVL